MVSREMQKVISTIIATISKKLPQDITCESIDVFGVPSEWIRVQLELWEEMIYVFASYSPQIPEVKHATFQIGAFLNKFFK